MLPIPNILLYVSNTAIKEKKNGKIQKNESEMRRKKKIQNTQSIYCEKEPAGITIKSKSTYLTITAIAIAHTFRFHMYSLCAFRYFNCFKLFFNCSSSFEQQQRQHGKLHKKAHTHTETHTCKLIKQRSLY